MHSSISFSKHALINKGFSAQLVSPSCHPHQLSFYQAERESVTSLSPASLFFGLKHRKVPDFSLSKSVTHSCDIQKCSFGFCWGCHSGDASSEQPRVSCSALLDCLHVHWGRWLQSVWQELKGSDTNLLNFHWEGKVLTGGRWKRKWSRQCGSA